MTNSLIERSVKSSAPVEPSIGRAKLNLGCGSRYRDGWTNVDIASVGPGVIAHDLRKPLPFSDSHFDLVYHSHVLEHFRRSDAPAFLWECRRVLKPGGLLRVVVPDLEEMARAYLAALDRCLAGDATATDDHAWMTLELFDQTVRDCGGGEMARHLSDPSLPNQSFVVGRLGVEARRIIDGARRSREATATARTAQVPRWSRRLRSMARPSSWREWAVRRLLGAEYEALRLGRFRLAGEIHQWMYDRVSLDRLLRDAGFGQVVRRRADESGIAGWSGEHLDTEPDGSVYKPDSLFMEASRPRT